MIRTKNFIVYLPSFAGHMLQTLFGTDPCVAPITNRILNNDSIDVRLKEYSFTNTTFNGHSWAKFHDYHDLDRVDVETWLATDYPIFVEARHPSHLDNLQMFPDVNYNIFIVELSMSEFACYWTTNAREDWDNFPVVQQKDLIALEKIKSNYTYSVINIDCFFDKHTWVDEYIRICKLMHITPCIEQSTKLFNTWYSLRVEMQKENFSKLSARKKQNYVNDRINGYRVNPLRFLSNRLHWKQAYNDVKDSSWPVCPELDDYFDLPQNIQHELKYVFNLHPDNFIYKQSIQR